MAAHGDMTGDVVKPTCSRFTREAVIAALAVAIGIAALLPAWNAPFFGDDAHYVTRNMVLQQTPLTQSWRFFIDRTNAWEYLPLRDLSLSVDLALFGVDARGFRAHNLLLYATGCWLLWLLIVRLMRGTGHSSALVCASATAATALFALHPAHVEAVVWASGRKDVLSMVLSLAALLIFSRAVTTERRAVHLFWSSLLFAAALLSKAAIIAVAPAAFAIALSLDGDTQGMWKRVRRALWISLPLIAVGVAGLILHATVGDESGIMNEDQASNISSITLLPLAILGYLTRIAVLPVNLRLIYDVSAPGLDLWIAYSFGATSVLASIAGALRLLRGRSALAVAAVLFVLFCLPYLQIIPFRTWSLASERFALMPTVWLALGAAVLFAHLRPAVARWVVLVIVVPFLVLTVQRSSLWTDPSLLMHDNVRHAPGHLVIIETEVDRLLGEDRFEEAQEAAAKASVAAIRTILSSYINAKQSFASGDRAAALSYLRQISARYQIGRSTLALSIANLALELGDAETAEAAFGRVLVDKPDYAEVRYNRGLALKALGNTSEAAAEIRRALDLGHDTPEAWNQLGLLLRDVGDLDEASKVLTEGARRHQKAWHGLYNLARIRISQGQTDEARRLVQMARSRAEALGDSTALLEALEQHLR